MHTDTHHCKTSKIKAVFTILQQINQLNLYMYDRKKMLIEVQDINSNLNPVNFLKFNSGSMNSV